MIPITFDGETAYLLTSYPDWTRDVELSARLPVHSEGGITGRENRTPLGDTLRLSLRYRTVLEGDAIAVFRNSLQAVANARVLCPLWAYPIAAGDTPTVEADYYAAVDDSDVPEIIAAGDMPAARETFPLMVGRLENWPEPTAMADELSAVEIQFTENSEYALTFPAITPDDGLDDGSSNARPLFPFRPNWATSPKSGGAEVEIQRREIGQSRETADAYFTQRARRPVQQFFTLSEDEPWQFLRLFQNLRGPGLSVWMPGSIAEANLTADVAALDTAVTVDEPTARGNNVALLLDDLTNRKCVLVTGTTGNDWDLSAAVGTAFTATGTRIETLILSRFESDEITLRFRDPQIASVQVSFVEVPWETDAVAGETIGDTIGGRAESAYLYVFQIAYPGATVTYRFTNYERDLTNSGNTYTAQHFQHEPVTETATLDRQQTSIESRNFSGNPLALFLPFGLEWPLQLDIYEADVSGSAASDLRRVFSGEVNSAEFDPPMIRASATTLKPVFDRLIPRILIQPTCNESLFSARCGLDRDDWKWTGEVVSYNAATGELALENVARVSGSGVTLTQHYFAGGYCYFGAGSAAQYRAIADNAAAIGTDMTIVIGSAFTTAPTVGAVVTFHPGCDGRYRESCTAKFGNASKFVGFPHMPATNPTAKAKNQKSGGGKK